MNDRDYESMILDVKARCSNTIHALKKEHDAKEIQWEADRRFAKLALPPYPV
jgi:hypothetical protein